MPDEQRLYGAGLARAAEAARAAPFSPSKTGRNGAPHPALRRLRVLENGAPHGAAYGAAEVIARLEEAGATLLALPMRGYATGLRMGTLDIVRQASEAYGWDANARLRPPVPSAARISRMDEAFSWLALIPDDRYVLRRIAAARALTHPLTGRHLYPWRRLGAALGADHKAVQRWHKEAVGLLVVGLGGR
uniref:DUF6362 domain-containing protein n=1 Tax=Acidicaldus sp. TaxID=1872105 RepID=A0A8J4HDL7_9PROT